MDDVSPEDLDNALLYVHKKNVADVPPIVWNLALRYIAAKGFRFVEAGNLSTVFGDASHNMSMGCVDWDSKIVAVATAGRTSMTLTVLHECAHIYQKEQREWSMIDALFASGKLEVQVEALVREVVRYFGGDADEPLNDYIAHYNHQYCLRPEIADKYVDDHLQGFLAALFDASASGSAPTLHVEKVLC